MVKMTRIMEVGYIDILPYDEEVEGHPPSPDFQDNNDLDKDIATRFM